MGNDDRQKKIMYGHNPYFNRWFSAMLHFEEMDKESEVTILILIDGFLQFKNHKITRAEKQGHNPYFNRWFSAI